MSSTHQCLNAILLLVFSSSIYTTANHTITVPCLSDHYSALLQLKGSFLKPNLSSWQPGTDCCHWEGVTCDTASGQVTALDLGGRHLQSHGLNPALFNLTSLRNLSLASNFFMGALPSIGFERLTEIILLNFSETNFVGQMPVGIARLNKLVILDFSYNLGLYLIKPSFQTLIANLSNLRELHLNQVDISSSGATWSAALADSVPQLQALSLLACSLSGSIHPSFSRLYSLVSIELGLNDEITGEVPEFFANFSFLSTLSLPGNNFTGYFPIKVFQLKHLRTLDVSSNPVLSGHLPDFPSENHLEVLSLDRTNFSGDMPASIVNLKSLEVLRLRTIETPNESTSLIAKLPSLVSLSLSGSGAEKPMLSWIGSLKHLTRLDLYKYNLSGPIPSWIRNITNLTVLQMMACSLSGPIPSWIRHLTQLACLRLDSNNVTGNIPKSLFAHPTLQFISLPMNQLSGSLEEIPAPLSSPLWFIDLSSNQLSGPIPKSFFQLTSLRALWLDSNKLVGTVELNSLCKLKNLHGIHLSNNMLSVLDGEGDSLFQPVCNIRYLRLASCNIKKLPVILRYLDDIFELDLSSNQLHGVIPSWVWENGYDSLNVFNLSHNMFTNLEKNPFLIPMRSLEVLDLSYNSLQGNLPLIDTYSESSVFIYSNNDFSSILSDFGSYLSTTSYLDLSKNKINGQVPTSICGASKLQFLDLSYNNFTGLVPSCLIEGGNLSMLKLRENQFHGILPKNIREGCMFETIDLNRNQIEGRLPKSLSNCQFLQVLDVGNNQIVDFFPSWLGNLPKLRVLVLKSNQFNGTVRGLRGNKNRKYFGSLQIIDMASNNFTGIIHSEWFEHLHSMMANDNNGQVLGNNYSSGGLYQYMVTSMVTITYKGLDLTFAKILTSFKVMDFSDNSFYGVIPQSIGRLVSLHGLNMSHNAFTGKIPSQLGNLMQLESLDLSWNQLSGTIPQELTSLTSLAWLNLSCNNLTGKIPQDNQFLSFPNSSFEGNIGLCGSPLSKQCGTSSLATSSMPASSTPTGWSQDRIGVVLLFLFIGLGFGVGFAFAIIFQMVCKVKG